MTGRQLKTFLELAPDDVLNAEVTILYDADCFATVVRDAGARLCRGVVVEGERIKLVIDMKRDPPIRPRFTPPGQG